MHIHILGICGTFMGSIAQLAKAMGHQVSGSDQNVYPPMSTQLRAAGIEINEGFDASQLDRKPDLVIVGNVISRGNPSIEAVLDKRIPYVSGPQWLSANLLRDKWVLAVAGTHGKTTTSSMLAWILDYAGFEPGYLIGGVPSNFPQSARLGCSDFFVIEADEYDTAFFDKRSKFVHYHPSTLVLNNLEFDHADIFSNLSDIQKQFHHLIRLVPSTGQIIYPNSDSNLQEVIDQGCWSEVQTLGGDWIARKLSENANQFAVYLGGDHVGEVSWNLIGDHNLSNGLAAVAAARHVGIAPVTACEALCNFKGVKRRLEKLGEKNGISVYDDFAHHPTAIVATIDALRATVGDEKIYTVIEPRSNTMKQGVHKECLLQSVRGADKTIWLQPENLDWELSDYLDSESNPISKVCFSVDEILALLKSVEPQSHILVMSNGSFSGIHHKILQQL